MNEENDRSQEDDLIIEDEVSQEEPKKNPKKSGGAKIPLLILLVVALVGAAAFGTYMWRESVASSASQKQDEEMAKANSKITSLEAQIAELKKVSTTKTDITKPCTEVAPNESATSNIKASITSGNTAGLEGYMASSVNVILAASEAYGPRVPSQAVTDISNFITTDNTSWDYNFNLPTAKLAEYKSGDYKQYFSDISVAGRASNNKVISFSFDCNGKIDTVLLMM